MYENSRFHWMSWIGHMLRRLRRGNIKGAAWMLVCCMPHEEQTAVDRWGIERMFQHREIAGLHQQLWDIMKPEVVPEYVSQIEASLKELGWQIS